MYENQNRERNAGYRDLFAEQINRTLAVARSREPVTTLTIDEVYQTLGPNFEFHLLVALRRNSTTSGVVCDPQSLDDRKKAVISQLALTVNQQILPSSHNQVTPAEVEQCKPPFQQSDNVIVFSSITPIDSALGATARKSA